MIEDTPPALPPEEAIAFFRAKGITIGFDWRDVWQEEHARTFTVAKAMTRDLVEDIRAAVDKAISEGQTLAQFAKDLQPLLFARGWWGRNLMTDPDTGEQRVVQLGSPARLRTIYQVNMRTAYQAGRWERIQRTRSAFPFLRYSSVKDGRERPEHGAWHGTVLPVNHPWWDTHYPPVGWNCRCTVIAMNSRMLERRGLTLTENPPRFPIRTHVNKRTGEVTQVEQGVDPGWSYNVGKAYLDGLTPSPLNSGGDRGALAMAQNLSDLSEDDERVLSAFFNSFDLSLDAARRGRIWRDAQGWPMAIALGLMRTANGAISNPFADSAEAERIARTITAPDSIGWAWVRDRQGKMIMMRRYKAGETRVDIGRIGWRWNK